MNDLFASARAAGAISIFVAMFTAFGIFLFNPTIGSIPTLIVITFVAVMIVGLSGWVWDLLFKSS